MVREARLLWDNPQLQLDDVERLRQLKSGSDPRPPRKRKSPRRRLKPPPASAKTDPRRNPAR